MAENTNIGWCDHTHNWWVGCTKVSPACDNCYAEGWSKRSGRDVWGPHAARQKTKTRKNLLKWNKALEGTGRKETTFPSLSDPFDNHKSILQEWRDEMWGDIRICKNLIFLLLTKRPQNIKKMLPEFWDEIKGRVWLGVTVENQAEACRRVPHLLAIPDVIRFVSCEPLLDKVDLASMSILDILKIYRDVNNNNYPINFYNSLKGQSDIHPIHGAEPDWGKLHWVIVGCESLNKNPGRTMLHTWAKYLKAQCQEARTAFFMKQMVVDEKVTDDITKFPKELQIREFPEAA